MQQRTSPRSKTKGKKTTYAEKSWSKRENSFLNMQFPSTFQWQETSFIVAEWASQKQIISFQDKETVNYCIFDVI